MSQLIDIGLRGNFEHILCKKMIRLNTGQFLVQYINHLNTGQVWYSNGPVIKWHFGICGPKPFENRTYLYGFQMPFEYRTLKSPVFR